MTTPQNPRKFDPISRAIGRVNIVHEDQLIDPNCTFEVIPPERAVELMEKIKVERNLPPVSGEIQSAGDTRQFKGVAEKYGPESVSACHGFGQDSLTVSETYQKFLQEIPNPAEAYQNDAEGSEVTEVPGCFPEVSDGPVMSMEEYLATLAKAAEQAGVKSHSPSEEEAGLVHWHGLDEQSVMTVFGVHHLTRCGIFSNLVLLGNPIEKVTCLKCKCLAEIDGAVWDDEFVHSSAKVEQYGKQVRTGLTRCGEESRRRRVSGNPAELTCLKCKSLLAIDTAVIPEDEEIPQDAMVDLEHCLRELCKAEDLYTKRIALMQRAIANSVLSGVSEEEIFEKTREFHLVLGFVAASDVSVLAEAIVEEDRENSVTGLTAEQLGGFPTGTQITDCDGDIWNKIPSGLWLTELIEAVNGKVVEGTASAVVIAACGPVQLRAEPYIGHARRQAIREILENKAEQEAVAAQHKDCCGEKEQ